MNDNKTQTNVGFIIRLFSYLLDVCLYWLVLLLPFYAILRVNESRFGIDPLMPVVDLVTLLLILLFLTPLITLMYNIYFTANFGGTIGKLSFGAKVLNTTSSEQSERAYIDYKTAFYRYMIGYIFSGGFFGLGFLRIIWNPSNLAWHDELFNTRVMKSGSYIAGFIVLALLIVAIAFVSLESFEILNRVLFSRLPAPTQ